jgi:hypothetical protein
MTTAAPFTILVKLPLKLTVCNSNGAYRIPFYIWDRGLIKLKAKNFNYPEFHL